VLVELRDLQFGLRCNVERGIHRRRKQWERIDRLFDAGRRLW
jgi:hypothetical protein